MVRNVFLQAALCALLLGVTNAVVAAGKYPVPLHMPAPDMSSYVRDGLWTGNERVRVRILVRADGTVRFIEAVNTTDPLLVDPLRRAVEQWLFEPWTPQDPLSEGEIVSVTYLYPKKVTAYLPLTANVELKKVRCHKLNLERARHNIQWNNRKGIFELPTIHATRRYLSEGNVIKEFIPFSERQALIEALLKAGPEIVARCKAEPSKLYVDMLPERLREML